MKRKLTSGIFALAALLTVSSAFYSCKDYDEELTADYTSKITTLEEALNSKLTAVQSDITALQQKDATQQTEIDGLSTSLSTLESEVDALTTNLGDLKVQVEENTGKITVLEQDLTTAQADIEAAKTAIITAQTDIQNIKTDVSTVKTDLNTVKTDLSGVQTLVNTVQGDLTTLTSRVDALEALLKEMVTSVEVRVISNPVIGSLVLPLDVQTNILAAYYGQTSSDLNFPTAKLDGSIEPTDAAVLWNTDESKSNTKYYGAESATNAYFADAQAILSDSIAGTIYMDINPSNVDFTGKDVQLVNTNKEQGPFSLSTLAAVDTVLNFGYTRADDAADVKLYASNAKVTDIDKAKFVISQDALDAVAQLKNANTNGINFKNLAIQLQSSMTNLGTIYDVQTLNNVDGKAVSVRAGQNIGAYAVKPLSYSFMEGTTLNLHEIPALDEIVNKIEGNIKNAIETAKTRFIDGTKGAMVRFYFNVDDENASNLNKLSTFDKDDALLEKEVATITFQGKDYPAYLTKEINEDGTKTTWLVYVDYPVTDINGTIDEYIGKAQVKMENAVAKVEPTYTKVQNFANKVINYVKEPNKLLQPVALYADNDGSYSSLSAVKAMPTQFAAGKDLTIYPISYTDELLAPAFKKYIAVLGYESVSNKDGKDAVPDQNKCGAACKCHPQYDANGIRVSPLTDCYWTAADEAADATHKAGTPKYIEDGKYLCHPAINGNPGHQIGDAECDLTYCTCTPGYCPNVYCVNHFDADGKYHSTAKDAVPETYSDKPVVKQQGVFDGSQRVYTIKGLAAGKYTIIYQALDYSGNIRTKYYYITVAE